MYWFSRGKIYNFLTFLFKYTYKKNQKKKKKLISYNKSWIQVLSVAKIVDTKMLSTINKK